MLVRYLAQDDARQAASATRLIEKQLNPTQQGFISLVVVAELCWVLSSLYGATMDELVATIEDFLIRPSFVWKSVRYCKLQSAASKPQAVAKLAWQTH